MHDIFANPVRENFLFYSIFLLSGHQLKNDTWLGQYGYRIIITDHKSELNCDYSCSAQKLLIEIFLAIWAELYYYITVRAQVFNGENREISRKKLKNSCQYLSRYKWSMMKIWDYLSLVYNFCWICGDTLWTVPRLLRTLNSLWSHWASMLRWIWPILECNLKTRDSQKWPLKGDLSFVGTSSKRTWNRITNAQPILTRRQERWENTGNCLQCVWQRAKFAFKQLFQCFN